MSFEIYFDESNKLDKAEGICSYYGIIGWDSNERLKFDDLLKGSKIFGELHFSEFKLDKIDNYILALEYALSRVKSNFYIVNKKEAFKVATKLKINDSNLRNLFYIKIPERLIYGMTREISSYIDITIFIDKSEEYGNSDTRLYNNELITTITNKVHRLYANMNSDINLRYHQLNNIYPQVHKHVEIELSKSLNHIQLPNTLKNQLNAQSLYRDLNYSVHKVRQIDSKSSKSLQITDVLLGIIRFLHEEEYFDLSKQIDAIIVDESIFKSACITEDEVNSFNRCYAYNKKINSYILVDDVSPSDIVELRQISKKLKLYSKLSIQKSEFIFRLIQNDKILDHLSQLKIFTWESYNLFEKTSYIKNFKEVFRMSISDDIVKFLKFKNEYDNYNKLALMDFYSKSDLCLKEKDFTKSLGFGSNLKLLVRRYLKELNISPSK
ncbi:DUF3800 domain-containing protein (plasmid) [Paraclostridium tenue]